MTMKKRKFTEKEKLTIIKECKANGVKPTLAKYGVFPATYYHWKKKYESMGDEGLKHGMTPLHLQEIRRLEKENDLLKKIVAEKEMESKLKDELLKKKYALGKGKS